MKRILLTTLFLGMIFLSINIVSATIDTHPQNTPFTLSFESNNATVCTITGIQYPAGNTINLNITASKSDTLFTSIFNQNNYTTLGRTCHYISCTDSINIETGSVCVDVTPSGFRDTLGFYFILILLGGLFILLGFSIKDPWFVVVGGIGFCLIGIYSLNSGIAGQRDMFITWGVALFEIFMGLYLSINSALQIMDME